MLGGGRRCCSVCSAALILSMLRSQRLRDEPSEWPRCFPQRALLAATRCVQTRYRAGRPDRSTLAVSAVSASGGVQLSAMCTLRGTMHTCILASRVLGSAVDSLHVGVSYLRDYCNVFVQAARDDHGLPCVRYQKKGFFRLSDDQNCPYTAQ